MRKKKSSFNKIDLDYQVQMTNIVEKEKKFSFSVV